MFGCMSLGFSLKLEYRSRGALIYNTAAIAYRYSVQGQAVYYPWYCTVDRRAERERLHLL